MFDIKDVNQGLVLAVRPSCCLSFVVAVVVRAHPRSMPLAMLTINKELHGFLLHMYLVLFL